MAASIQAVFRATIHHTMANTKWEASLVRSKQPTITGLAWEANITKAEIVEACRGLTPSMTQDRHRTLIVARIKALLLIICQAMWVKGSTTLTEMIWIRLVTIRTIKDHRLLTDLERECMDSILQSLEDPASTLPHHRGPPNLVLE